MTVFSLHVPNILENTVKRKHIRKQSYDVKGYIPIIFFHIGSPQPQYLLNCLFIVLFVSQVHYNVISNKYKPLNYTSSIKFVYF